MNIYIREHFIGMAETVKYTIILNFYIRGYNYISDPSLITPTLILQNKIHHILIWGGFDMILINLYVRVNNFFDSFILLYQQEFI
jgi:hypothetical protein